MYKRHILGNKGEKLASEYLRKYGYEIVERNFSCRQGEIDIIAKTKRLIKNQLIYETEYVFIEVKTRTSDQYGRPSEAVNYLKQRHIIESTKYYIFINNFEKYNIRFDVIVFYENDGCDFINHLKNCEIYN